MRVLLVGGGCRGLGLARNLIGEGHAVRVVTRDEGKRERIEAAGAECWIGDPDVVGTLRYALESVTVLVWALGTARGDADDVAALHGPRLQMMLSRAIDSTVRGVVYEAAGPVAADVLAEGVAELRRMCELNEIPYALVEEDPRDASAWKTAAHHAINHLLGVR